MASAAGAGANAAALIMRSALVAIGLNDEAAEDLETWAGVSLSDLEKFDDKNCEEIIDEYNADNNNEHRANMMVKKNFVLLAFWVKERTYRGKPLVDPDNSNRIHPHMDLGRLTLYGIIKDRDAARRKLDTRLDKVPKFKDGQKWDKFCDLFTNFCRNIPGATGEGLYYLLRPPKADGWDPETDASSEEEKRIYQLLHTGEAFVEDVQKLWSILVPATREHSTVWNTVKIHCHDQLTPASGGDALAAWKAIWSQYEGDDARHHKEADALALIAKGGSTYGGQTYVNEFTDKVAEIVVAFTTLEQNPDRRYADSDKVKVLVQMCSPIHANHCLGLDVHKVKTKYRDNFQGAINYLTTRVAEEYKDVTLPSQPIKNARRIRQAGRSDEYRYSSQGKTFSNVWEIPQREWDSLPNALHQDILQHRELLKGQGRCPEKYRGKRNQGRGRGRGGRQFPYANRNRGGRSSHRGYGYGRGNAGRYQGRGYGRGSGGGRYGGRGGQGNGRGFGRGQYNGNDRSINAAQRTGDAGSTASGLPNSISVAGTAAAQSALSTNSTSRGGRAGFNMGAGSHL